MYCATDGIKRIQFQYRVGEHDFVFPHGNCRLRYKRDSDVLKIYISVNMVFVLFWRTHIIGTKHVSATYGHGSHIGHVTHVT